MFSVSLKRRFRNSTSKYIIHIQLKPSADVSSSFVKAESEKMQDKEEMKSFDEEKLAAYMMGRWKNGMFTSLGMSIGNQ